MGCAIFSPCLCRFAVFQHKPTCSVQRKVSPHGYAWWCNFERMPDDADRKAVHGAFFLDEQESMACRGRKCDSKVTKTLSKYCCLELLRRRLVGLRAQTLQ